MSQFCKEYLKISFNFLIFYKYLHSYTIHEESAFVFLYPRTFLAGKNETVCAVFQSKYFPARIKIDMKIKNKHTVYHEVLQSGIFLKVHYILIKFMQVIEIFRD